MYGADRVRRKRLDWGEAGWEWLMLYMSPRVQPSAAAADADVVASVVRDDGGVQLENNDLTNVDWSEPSPGWEGGQHLLVAG